LQLDLQAAGRALAAAPASANDKTRAPGHERLAHALLPTTKKTPDPKCTRARTPSRPHPCMGAFSIMVRDNITTHPLATPRLMSATEALQAPVAGKVAVPVRGRVAFVAQRREAAVGPAAAGRTREEMGRERCGALGQAKESDRDRSVKAGPRPEHSTPTPKAPQKHRSNPCACRRSLDNPPLGYRLGMGYLGSGPANRRPTGCMRAYSLSRPSAALLSAFVANAAAPGLSASGQRAQRCRPNRGRRGPSTAPPSRGAPWGPGGGAPGRPPQAPSRTSQGAPWGGPSGGPLGGGRVGQEAPRSGLLRGGRAVRRAPPSGTSAGAKGAPPPPRPPRRGSSGGFRVPPRRAAGRP
jgi:hypothetical protein